MSAPIDITGQKFGRLTAIRFVRSTRKQRVWLCECECGRRAEVRASKLRYGSTRSCGCLQPEAARAAHLRHGHASRATASHGTPEYRVWATMIQRCGNPKNGSWRYYGALGVHVCRRWRRFENFLADMGRRPKGKRGQRARFSIDRFPNPAGNYQPSNCRWATMKEQATNRRKHRWRSEDDRRAARRRRR
jgi:hypothetical protein